MPWYSLGIVTLESFPIYFVIFQVFDLVSSNLKFFLKFNKSSSLVGFSGFGSGLSSGLTSGVVPGFSPSGFFGSSGLTSGVVPGFSPSGFFGSSGLTSGLFGSLHPAATNGAEITKGSIPPHGQQNFFRFLHILYFLFLILK
ncbi:hypothetical protein ACP0CJ_01975 [Metamycoplasma hominis]|uniref:hypothetical protein n=1 Tax=Metamycoplasma hominis TaxID=2098 RepID=UPI003CF55C40